MTLLSNVRHALPPSERVRRGQRPPHAVGATEFNRATWEQPMSLVEDPICEYQKAERLVPRLTRRAARHRAGTKTPCLLDGTSPRAGSQHEGLRTFSDAEQLRRYAYNDGLISQKQRLRRVTCLERASDGSSAVASSRVVAVAELALSSDSHPSTDGLTARGQVTPKRPVAPLRAMMTGWPCLTACRSELTICSRVPFTGNEGNGAMRSRVGAVRQRARVSRE